MCTRSSKQLTAKHIRSLYQSKNARFLRLLDPHCGQTTYLCGELAQRTLPGPISGAGPSAKPSPDPQCAQSAAAACAKCPARAEVVKRRPQVGNGHDAECVLQAIGSSQLEINAPSDHVVAERIAEHTGQHWAYADTDQVDCKQEQR